MAVAGVNHSRARRYAILFAVAYLFWGGILSDPISKALATPSSTPIHIGMTASIGLISYYIYIARYAPPPHVTLQPDNPAQTHSPTIDWDDYAGESGGNTRYPETGYEQPNVIGTIHELIGRCDPVDGTSLCEGEAVMVCNGCFTGYHTESWQFLVQQNNSTCVNCRSATGAYLLRLSGAHEGGQTVFERHICPRCRTTNRVPSDRPRSLAKCGACHAHLFSVAPHVGLETVSAYIGRMVLFQGVVLDSYRTKSGTHFIKFEEGHVRNVFKVVIFKQYASSVADIRIYKGRSVRVHGLVQRHPRWGLEMVVKDGSLIEVL